MARTMVNCKFSIHLFNCRGWPWGPPAIRITHAGHAVARWPIHAAWRCRQKNYVAQLARILTEWHCNSFTDLIDEMELWDWNVANKDFWSWLAKSLHMYKVSVFSALPCKDELSNGDAVHPEVQNTKWEDWRILWRRSSPRIGEDSNRLACKPPYCRAWQESPSQKSSGNKKTTRWTGSSQHAHDRHKLRRKVKRRAADSRGADGRGGGRYGGV